MGVGNLGNYAAVVALIHGELAPMLVGRDPRDVTAVWEAVLQRQPGALRRPRGPDASRGGPPRHHDRSDSPASTSRCGTCSDAPSVMPVWRLLGGRFRERIPAYASGGWAPVGGVGKQLLQYVERGHRAVKMRVGLQDRSVERLRRARPRGARDARPRHCAHGGRPRDLVGARRPALRPQGRADCDLAWLEEPVSPDNVAGQAEVRASTDIPIAAGESEQTRFAFRELIEARAVDVLQPDPAIAGGITEAQRICALAAAHGLDRGAPPSGAAPSLFAAGLHSGGRHARA